MKKGLKILIVFVLLICNKVYAADSTTFYLKLFREIKIADFQEVNDQAKTPAFVLLRASDINDSNDVLKQIRKYDNAIIVCDINVTYLVFDNINCVKEPPLLLFNNKKEDVLKTIFIHKADNTRIYFVPQLTIINPSYAPFVLQYFKALAHSYNLNTNAPVIVNTTNKSEQMFKGVAVEIFAYFLGISILITLCGYILRKLENNLLILLQPQFYKNQFENILRFLKQQERLIRLIVIVQLSMCIPIAYGIYVKEQQAGNPHYALELFRTTFNPANYNYYLENLSIPRLGLLAFTYTLAIFIFLLVFQDVYELFLQGINRLPKIKLPNLLITWSIPTIIISIGVLMMYFSLEQLAILLAVYFIIIGIICAYVIYHKVDYNKLLPLQYKIALVIMFFLILGIQVAFPKYFNKDHISYKYILLFDVRTSSQTAPYHKRLNKDELFLPFKYQGNSLVFVNNYLIYAPNKDTILNTAEAKDQTITDTVLTFHTIEEFASKTLSNPDIIAMALAKTPTTTFLVKNNLPSDNLYLELLFLCKQNSKPTAIELEKLSIINNKIAIESSVIMNFPGCTKDLSEETFRVPLNKNTLRADLSTLYNVKGKDNTLLIKSARLFSLDNELDIIYIDASIPKDNFSKVLKTDSKTYSNTIVNLITNSDKPHKIEINTDLSKAINELITKGLIKQPLVIWTSAPYELFY